MMHSSAYGSPLPFDMKQPVSHLDLNMKNSNYHHSASAYSPTSVTYDMSAHYHHAGQPATQQQPSMAIRSASEASMDNNSNKYRQLPCRTFISVGTCPYRERCVYLHDPRCICREAKTKTRRKNKEDVVLDSLFWPIMPYSMVAGKLDSNRQPHVIQQYVVPPPQSEPYRRHDEAVYSMWMHFVDFCSACSESVHAASADQAPCFMAPDRPFNAYTNKFRLPVFRTLSAGLSFNAELEEKEEAVNEDDHILTSTLAQVLGDKAEEIVALPEAMSRSESMESLLSFDSSLTPSDCHSDRMSRASSFHMDNEDHFFLPSMTHHVDNHHILHPVNRQNQVPSPDNAASIWSSLSHEHPLHSEPKKVTELAKIQPVIPSLFPAHMKMPSSCDRFGF